MNGQEIANELGITRQAVSKLLQKSITKIYNRLDGDPKDKLLSMFKAFDITDEKDMKSMYKMLPKTERDKIDINMKKLYHIQG